MNAVPVAFVELDRPFKDALWSRGVKVVIATSTGSAESTAVRYRSVESGLPRSCQPAASKRMAPRLSGSTATSRCAVGSRLAVSCSTT